MYETLYTMNNNKYKQESTSYLFYNLKISATKYKLPHTTTFLPVN